MGYKKELDPWADEPIRNASDVPKELGVLPEGLTEGDVREYEEGKRQKKDRLKDRLSDLKEKVATLASKRELAATELARHGLQGDSKDPRRISELEAEIGELNSTEEELRDEIAQTKVEIDEMDRND